MSARFSLKITTLCHSVRSLLSPDWRSRHRSEVAIRMLTTFWLFWVWRTSGSRPRLPTRITLLTLPAMIDCLLTLFHGYGVRSNRRGNNRRVVQSGDRGDGIVKMSLPSNLGPRARRSIIADQPGRPWTVSSRWRPRPRPGRWPTNSRGSAPRCIRATRRPACGPLAFRPGSWQVSSAPDRCGRAYVRLRRALSSPLTELINRRKSSFAGRAEAKRPT